MHVVCSIHLQLVRYVYITITTFSLHVILRAAQSNCVDEIYVTKFIRSEAYDNIAFRVYVCDY